MHGRFSVRVRAHAAQVAVVLAASLCAVSVGAPGPVAGAAVPSVEALVRVQVGSEASVAQAIKSLGGDAHAPLKVLNGYMARIPSDRVEAVQTIPGVVSVVTGVDIGFDPAMYDPEEISSSLYQVAKNIGADDLWKDGYTGAGVDVAVIDSGIERLPHFAGRVVDGPDLSFGSDDAAPGTDQFGHGTHMAGIIAGRDPSVALDPKSLEQGSKRNFVGIAPGARLLNMKVAAPDGAVDVSQVIAAIDWVVEHRNSDGLNVRVLNLSFGTDGVQDYQIDPLTFAVENAWRHGIVVVVSAGNAGYGSPMLNNPAYDPYVIAVGASDTNGTKSRGDDFIADFSSRGDLARRPDIVAPGRSIVSLRDPDSLIDQAFPGGRVGDALFRGSGTSQAAAVTSGAVALLLQARPTMTPDQVKATLVSGGSKLRTRKGELLEKGMVSLDVDDASGRAKDVLEGKIPAAQAFPPATGLGSLEAARGSEHLTDGTSVLTGEVDVTGAAWDGRTWRDASWSGRTWRGDGWKGRTWRADGWNGRTWRAAGWNGRTWRGSGWMAAEFVPTGPLT
jgi:serine protease AprX